MMNDDKVVILLNFISKIIEKYDGVIIGRFLWFLFFVMYVIYVME